jgi:hypothetical protein
MRGLDPRAATRDAQGRAGTVAFGDQRRQFGL